MQRAGYAGEGQAEKPTVDENTQRLITPKVPTLVLV